jgi:hypothetical protein
MITVSIEVTFDCEKPKIYIEKHRNSKILFIENLAKITNIYCPAKVLLIDINVVIDWKYLSEKIKLPKQWTAPKKLDTF